MGRTIQWRRKSGPVVHEVIAVPTPHILVDSRKELHGWWRGKRECTAERLLINPYNGCAIDCFCCYAKALPGYFGLFHQHGVATVCRDFDRVVSLQLDGIKVASCGYLSPVTDPFQPLEKRYHLSQNIIAQFVQRNIPIEFITKCYIPSDIIELMRQQKHSFGQVSILTPREDLRRRLMKGGAATDKLFENLTRLAKNGMHAVCRIDPIVPMVTDRAVDLRILIRRAVDSGARHIVASIMDIPRRIAASVFTYLDTLKDGLGNRIRFLYRDVIDGSLHASLDYRLSIFSRMREECDQAGVTFALCMEYRLDNGKPVGLNRDFASSTNCEGIDIPLYARRGDQFQPVANCNGACLLCQDPICGIEDLAMGRPEATRRDFTLRDYRRWSRQLGLQSPQRRTHSSPRAVTERP